MGCSCPHHKIVTLAVTLIGLVFLLEAMNYMSAGTASVTWPILLIVIGLMKLFKGSCKCCSVK